VNNSRSDVNTDFNSRANEIAHPDAIEAAINRGVDYLSHHQYPNGEFCCYIAADEPMLKWCVTDSTVFATMVVASCLLPLSKKIAVEPMLSKATNYVYNQMHPGGVWPVFSNRHLWHKIVPYDADSLAFASALLEDRSIQPPVNKPLLLANRTREGLFYTWFIFHPRLHTNRTLWRLSLRELKKPVTSFFFWRANECAHGDVDLGINANVLFYLGEIPETAPVINELIRVINEGREGDCDKWYRNPFTIYYLISRAYNRGVKKLQPVAAPIIDRIVATALPDGQLGKSVLDTAIGATTLINFGFGGEVLHEAINFLIKKQEPHGEWPRWLLYYGGPKLLQGWGSEELTTAFCLEAIARYKWG
jgi:hypothetical protein